MYRSLISKDYENTLNHMETNLQEMHRQRIKIGLLTPLYSRSGVEQVGIAVANMALTHPYEMNMFSAYPPENSLKDELSSKNKFIHFYPLITNPIIRVLHKYAGPARSMFIPLDIKRIQRMVDVIINIHAAQFPITSLNKPYIAYIHFPFSLKSLSYIDRLHNKIQTPLFQLISSFMTRKKACQCKFVCNSHFTMSVFTESWPELYDLATVIHPPVNVHKYLRSSSKEPRSNTIVTIAGFERSKRIDIALSAMELIKEDVPSAKLVIIGSMRSPFSHKILHELKKMVSKKALENNVSFLPNADNITKTSILSSAKVLLHPTQYEHFGISIVEGMASGCVPIVPKNGGPYLDIIDRGHYGLSFTDKYDAADKAIKVLTNDRYRIAIKEKAIRRSLSFTSETFDAKFSEVIDHLF